MSLAFLKENEIVEATKMKKSLWNYESPEVKEICPGFLKGVIDGALGILGTWSANVLAPTQPQIAGAPLGNYTFKAITPINESDHSHQCTTVLLLVCVYLPYVGGKCNTVNVQLRVPSQAPLYVHLNIQGMIITWRFVYYSLSSGSEHG